MNDEKLAQDVKNCMQAAWGLHGILAVNDKIKNLSPSNITVTFLRNKWALHKGQRYVSDKERQLIDYFFDNSVRLDCLKEVFMYEFCGPESQSEEKYSDLHITVYNKLKQLIS